MLVLRVLVEELFFLLGLQAVVLLGLCWLLPAQQLRVLVVPSV
jgi:hypothetical protein